MWAALAALAFGGPAVAVPPAGPESRLTPELQKEMLRAGTLYLAGELDKAAAALTAVEKEAGVSVRTLNLRGAIATRKKEYDRARDYFQRALELVPKSVALRLNIAETEILAGNYVLARKMISEIPAEPKTQEVQQFYLILSYLLEGKADEADALLKQMKEPSDTAAFYFAQAARAFWAGDTVAGDRWVAAAQKIFGRRIDITLYDVLANQGWITIKPRSLEALGGPDEDEKPIAEPLIK